jgi:hypothetical protein
MARNIDWSQPLSDEDRAWAEQRQDMLVDGRPIRELIQENDEANGKEAKDAAKSRTERIQEIDAELANLQNEKERLVYEEQQDKIQNQRFGGTEDDARKGLGFVDNTPVNGEKPEGAPDAPEDYSNETYWNKAKLTEEIKARNVERERDGLKPLATTGNRAELVERLQRDDEELAGA